MQYPFRSHQDLEKQAEAFLARYVPERVIPVPIEEIIEVDLGIDITPIPGFARRFGVEGYISNDMQMLIVDEETMKRNPGRYRFTIAHEISHLLLHADFIRQEFPRNVM